MTFKTLIIKIKYTKSYFYVLVFVMGMTLYTLYNWKSKIYILKEATDPQKTWQSPVGLLNSVPTINVTSRPIPKPGTEKFIYFNKNIDNISFKNINVIANLSINNSSDSKEFKIKNQSDYLRIEFDRHRISTRIWPKNDALCGSFRIYFARPNSLLKCGISSFPGSGNTWLRRLIEAATGVFTGSQYDDGSIYLNGYFGELDAWDAGTTIAQKTHMVSEKFIESLDSRGIFIIRNPYKAVLSLHNFMFGGHHMFAPIINYRRKDWPSFVHLQIKHWLKTVINWVTVGKEVLVIHYENLLRDPIKELRRVLEFLRVLPDEGRLGCIQRNHFMEFKRTEEYFPESLTIFPNITRDKMDRAIRYVAFLLEKHGHEKPPLQFYEFYNNTSSNKINLIACKERESMIDCYARIDELNFNSRNPMNNFQEKTYKFITGIMKFVTEDPVKRLLQEESHVSRNATSPFNSINELK